MGKRKREEKAKKVLLPALEAEIEGKPTLVLGLDNTLCVIDRKCNKVVLRPGVHSLLATVRDLYEIVAFTTFEKKQADRLYKAVNRGGNWIPITLLSRGACTKDPKTFGNFYKELPLLGRDMSKVIALDANVNEHALNMENVIPIKPFTGEEEEEDYELFRVEPFLQEVSGVRDMPEAVKEYLEQEDELEEFDKQRVALFEAGDDPGSYRAEC